MIKHQKLNTVYGEPHPLVKYACDQPCPQCSNKNCGGCKRVPGERLHSFMVVFNESSDLVLSANSEEEMLDWMQALCEAVVGKKVCVYNMYIYIYILCVCVYARVCVFICVCVHACVYRTSVTKRFLKLKNFGPD